VLPGPIYPALGGSFVSCVMSAPSTGIVYETHSTTDDNEKGIATGGYRAVCPTPVQPVGLSDPPNLLSSVGWAGDR